MSGAREAFRIVEDERSRRNGSSAEGEARPGQDGYLLPSQSLEDFMEESGGEVEWVVENLLAKGAVTDFAGPPKHGGKTTFWLCAIAACADGRTHAGFETREGVRFFYLTEQGNNFAQAIEDASLLDHPDALRISQYKDVAGLAWGSLIDAAAKDAVTMGAEVLIIDTFAAFAGLAEGDENLAGPVGERVRALRLVAQKYGLAVLLIRHAGKDGTPRGSSAFEAEADICVVIQRPEGRHDPRVRRLAAVGRYGAWERNVQLVDGAFVSLGGDDRVEFNQAVRFIRATLPESPEAGTKKKDLLDLRTDDDGFSAATLGRALTWLVKEKAVGEKQLMNRRGKPKVYWLATEQPDPDRAGPDGLFRSPVSGGGGFDRNKQTPQNSETTKNEANPIGKGKGIYFDHTTPPYLRDDRNNRQQTPAAVEDRLGSALSGLLSDDAPPWLQREARLAAGDPDRHLGALCFSVASATFKAAGVEKGGRDGGVAGLGEEIRPSVLAWISDREAS